MFYNRTRYKLSLPHNLIIIIIINILLLLTGDWLALNETLFLLLSYLSNVPFASSPMQIEH